MNSINAINDGIFRSTNRGSFSMSFIILPDYFCQCDKSYKSHLNILKSIYAKLNWERKLLYTNSITTIIIQIRRKLVSQKELNFHRYINNFLFAEITCGKKSFLLHT